MSPMSRIAGAPISWGVNEVSGWGYQMSAERVLGEAASLGLSAMESGPEGFLPRDPAEASRLLGEHGLRLVGGFVPVVLHRADVREEELASVEQQAELFAAIGADALILAASTGQDSYEETVELDDGSWDELFESLASVEEIGTVSPLRCTLTSGPRSNAPTTCAVSSTVARWGFASTPAT
jgi:inosose dehydratase